MTNRRFLVVVWVACMLLASAAHAATPSPQTSAQVTKPSALTDIVNMDIQNEDVLNIYNMLGKMANLNVIADPTDVKGKMLLKLSNITLKDALDQVSWYTGYQYIIEGSTLTVASTEKMKTLRRVEMDFVSVSNITLSTAESLIKTAVPGITVQLDDKAQKLLITGSSDQLAKAKTVLAQYDVPKPQTFDFQDEPIPSALRSLAKSAGINVMVTGDVSGKISIVLSNMAPRDAFDFVVRQIGLVAETSPEGIISLKPATKPEVITGTSIVTPVETKVSEETRLLQVKFLPLQTVVDLLAATFPNLKCKSVPNSLLIAATGIPSDLNAAEELLAVQDFPTVRVGGIVQQGDVRLAFLEVAGKSYFVKEGDSIDGLQVELVSATGVTVSLNNRREYIAVGGSK